jgi:hypothetical protein
MPNPSLPNIIPTDKNSNNAGTPYLELALPARMLKKKRTDSIKINSSI